MKKTTLNDAVIYGKPNKKVLNKEIKIGMSNDGAATRPNAWKHITGTVQNLVDFLSTHKEGPKDGTCILMGEAVGVRSASAMKDLCIMMMDHDSGEDFYDLCEGAEKSGYFTILWTTHSHGKPTTNIPRDHLVKWAKINKDKIDLDLVKLYLAKVKNYQKNILDTCELGGEVRTQNGIELVVNHKPMSKARSLRVLKEPFDYADFNTKQEGQKEWARYIAALADELGVTYDESCKDPSRLMYTPRHAADSEADHRIVIFNGDFVDLTEIEPIDIEKRDTRYKAGGLAEIFSNAGGDTKGKFQTPGLLPFVAKYGEVFNMATWLNDIAPDDIIEQVFKGGYHVICPNEEAHSNIDPLDKAFRVVDAGEEGPGFSAGCLHATCKDMSGEDRVWYLDQLCQKYDVKRADELKDWCEVLIDDVEQEETKSEVEQCIDGLSPESSSDDIRDFLDTLATVDDDLIIGKTMAALAKQTKQPLPSLRKELKQAIRRGREAAGEDLETRGPDGDLRDYTGPIQASWDFAIQQQAAANALIRKNKRKPRLFSTKGAGVPVRIIENKDKTKTEEMEHRQMAYEVGQAVQFRKQTEDGPVGVAPDGKIIEGILGDPYLDLPTLDRVINVPIFSADGKLRTREGYDKHSECYLKFLDGFEPWDVPKKPSEKDLDHALDMILNNAIHSFPFSDNFDGNEVDDPHKGDEEPNWNRGRSSRMNALAMILQPFCRNMIKGATPAYHVDKSAPGTGAGYLLDVPYIIMTGKRAEGKPLSDNNDEVRKVITASLRAGNPILFFDNVNHKVDSGEFAAAITGGIWNDRILGKTEEVSIEITAQWIIAGNNMSMSAELTRRMLPIRMDANDPNPEDRGPEWFKHQPIQKWLEENREELVWSCHTIIQYWISKGSPKGKALFNSFDGWSATMSGIFEACGVKGFLENRKEYMESISEDNKDIGGVIEYIWEMFKEKEFTAKDLHDMAYTDGLGWDFEIDIEHINGTQRKRLLSRFMRQHVNGRTFKFGFNGKDIKVKCGTHTARQGGRVHFRLTPM